jgi:hypothetical protein
MLLPPFLCLVLCLFDSRTPTHTPPLSVTIHQGGAILATVPEKAKRFLTPSFCPKGAYQNANDPYQIRAP